MNRTAVISCGPSWKEFLSQPDGTYSTVIGCNWVPERIMCDWVVAHDANAVVNLFWPRESAVAEPLARGEPHWFLHWWALWKLRPGELYDRGDIMEYLAHQHVMTWPASDAELPYTGLAALRLLAILGIDKADLYGYDMVGQTNGVGSDSLANRPDGWQREQHLFEDIAARNGLQLNRIGVNS